KTSELAPEPASVVTVILPLTALTGSGSTILSSCSVVNVAGSAATVPNATFVAAVKFEPSISTDSPGLAPLGGLKPVTSGGTLKSAVLVPVPSGETTWTFPVLAPAGTAAFSEVEVTFVILISSTPLKRTAVAPSKPVPLIV